MAKWIKNDDTIDHTYQGQLIGSGNYYQIQPSEEQRWSNDSILLKDICDAKALVSKDDSGTTDITDLADSINHLKDIKPEVQKTQNIISPDSITERFYGWPGAGSFVKTQTTTENLLIGEAGLYLRGGVLYTQDHTLGDVFSIKIVDVDNVLGFGAGAVLDDYLKDWPVNPSGVTSIISESIANAPIPQNTYLELTYKSVGTLNNVSYCMGIYSYNKD